MILGIRHGERGDKTANETEKKKVKLYYDPHLTDFGALQAQTTALEIQARLNSYSEELKFKGLGSGKKIIPVILCSPFLRTIQTAFNIASRLDCVFENSIFLQQEICEFIWDQQEFDKDPLPILFSKTKDLPDYLEYGCDFINSGIKLKSNLFSDPEFIQAKWPELKEVCQKRVAVFLKKIAKLFFAKFRYTEYALVWVAHQYCLASGIWHYTDLTPATHPDDLVQICGILDCRYPDPENNLEKFKILQIGTSPHLHKLEDKKI